MIGAFGGASAGGAKIRPGVSVSASGGAAATWRGNEPSGMTLLDEENWVGTSIPTQSDGGITGSSWMAVNPDGHLSIITDATEPQGGNAVQVVFPAGLLSGFRPGTLYRSMPSVREWYICSWIKLDSDFEWHPISNKFYFAGTADGPEVHIQARYGDEFFSLYNQGGGEEPVVNTTNPSDPADGSWHLAEWHVNLVAGTSSHWVDGVAVLINASITNPDSFIEMQIDQSWGGGGVAKATTNNRYHGTVYMSYRA